MKTRLPFLVVLICSVCLSLLEAQEGPFSPDAWPLSADATKEVHYNVFDPGASFPPVGDRWFLGDLTALSGGDQTTRPISIGGHTGLRTVGNYLNIADAFYFDWGDNEIIDILIQFYGNEAVLDENGEPRDFMFLTGTLPGGEEGNLNAVNGGSLPVEARNGKWNWALFRIPNEIRPDGNRYVSEPAANAQGDFSSGGVNGGTIRFENVPGLIIRVAAFGEEGAFGEPDQINRFEPPGDCPPEPETNLVFVDVHAQTSDHLVVLDSGDQSVSFQTDIGPAGDKRRAAIADGQFMNFGIADNYLGEPCNFPRDMKICVEFYDDPALAGVVFGPEAYATDSLGGTTIYPPERRHQLQGTGEWVRRSFVIPTVNLHGVNTGEFTGGPRFLFEGGQVYISRVDMAILRTGTHPLAGIDPLADCVEDPMICTDAYGNYAELDLHNDIQNGLAPGTSGGDQEMIIEEAGPEGDRRLAVRPAFDDGSPGFQHRYLNFAIAEEVFGPSSQPNAHLSICVTYYDDPNLAGATLRPEVYQVSRGGEITIAFTDPEIAVALEGSDQWREVYFEIPEIKFTGVNQGPQAAARFILSDKIYFTRVQYGVIRPCGPFAGVNPLEECKPIEPPLLAAARSPEGALVLSWPETGENFVLQQTETLSIPNWNPVETQPEMVDNHFRVSLSLTETTFFRLILE